MQQIIIRQATKSDDAIIYSLIKTAFETAEHKDGDEQDFAVNLRKSQNYIPQLELVAEYEGKLVGHIMLTKTYVTKPDGSKYNTLMVAPLSVLLEYRNRGVGSQLMKEGLNMAATMGYGAAFLLGDPHYYQRLGYKLSSLFGIQHETFPAEYLMAKEILPDGLKGITGLVNM